MPEHTRAAVEAMIDANREVRIKHMALIDKQEDLIERLWKALVASMVGMVALAVMLFVTLGSTTTREACTEWTVEVRNAAHEACCKGTLECPRPLEE